MTPPVIIIFGAAVRPDGTPSRALQNRVEAALRLGARLDNPLYMPTGGIGRHGPAEAEVMAAQLRDNGIASDRIQPEPTARNTLGSVRACAALLPGFRGRVYAATSAYHLPRCVLLLRMAGLRALPCPPPRSAAAGAPGRRWWWRLREVPAVPLDAAILAWLRLRGQVPTPPPSERGDHP